MKVHFVVHESFEAPGAFEHWVKARGYQASYSRVYRHEPLPASADGFDLLVVLGGPQSPATTLQECPYFDTLAEQALIRRAIDAGRLVLGVCLGAQLIGEALGAAHERSPEKEIGNFPVTLTGYGREHPKFAHVADVLEIGHWHNDMPGLTPAAKIIAFSEGCPRQIVEYSERVYGLQCHMELTPQLVEQLIEASAAELASLKAQRFVQPPEVLRANRYEQMNLALFGFLDCLVAPTEDRMA